MKDLNDSEKNLSNWQSLKNQEYNTEVEFDNHPTAVIIFLEQENKKLQNCELKQTQHFNIFELLWPRAVNLAVVRKNSRNQEAN